MQAQYTNRSTSGVPTVIVADDYDDARLFMRALLELRGFRVLEAANGLEAVELCKKDRPELILMDLRMPVLDGVEATRRIHAQQETCRTPIVAVSAHCGNDWSHEALDAGAVACVPKPVDFDVIDRIIATYLPAAEAPH